MTSHEAANIALRLVRVAHTLVGIGVALVLVAASVLCVRVVWWLT